MTKTKFSKDWIIRSFSSEVSDTERLMLVEWLESDPINRTEYSRLKAIWEASAQLLAQNSEEFEESWQRFLGHIHPVAKPKRNRRLFYFRVAASVALVAGFTATLIWLVPFNRQQIAQIPEIEIDKSYIITAEGQKVILPDNQTEIRYDSLLNGQAGLKGNSDRIQQEPQMLELVVPRSRRITLVLSDGSKIWLNSESRLRYPEYFTQNIRTVGLEGEAFFEVQKQAGKSFVVTTRQISIEVLGTSFNVSAYTDENQISTTLVQGSVKLRENGSSTTQLLKPNERAVYSAQTNNFVVEETDIELYTSWIHGYLKFSSESLDQVIQKLVRSYGIPMEIADPILKEYKFSGKLDLQETVNQVLNVIKLAAPLDYREENRKILILNKNE